MSNKKSGPVGRLVQVAVVEGVGKVRVGLDAEWSEYRVQVWAASGRMVAEYFTGDRADALGTADAMLAELAATAGIPA